MTKRIIAYVIGLVILGFGSAFAVAGDIGVSPMGAIPFVTYQATPGIEWLTTGTVSTLMFLVFIALQIIILRKDYRIIDTIQILFAFLFGFIFDFAIWVLTHLADWLLYGLTQPWHYMVQFGFLIASIVIIGIGLVLLISAKIVPLPPEALCLAINKRWEKTKFHVVKMSLDSSLVLIAIAISLIFIGNLSGIREGTIIAALAIGRIIPFVRKVMEPITKRIS
ncbi:MAG: DUF6198 family protein [Defluviitaleaceae bacterium]|nr:DUF6198 family protein [Defluviitaleaceae bacterium]